MPERIADLGFESDVPTRVKGGPDVTSSGLSTQQYFALSRIDGSTTLKALVSYIGLGWAEAVACIRALDDAGLITLPNRERPEQPDSPAKAPKAIARTSSGEFVVPDWSTPLSVFEFSKEDMEDDNALSSDMRKLVLYYHHHLEEVSYYDLFQIDEGASIRQLTDSYYQLSKLFHPDRWFRKELGRMEVPVRAVFRWINKAYRTLSKAARRKEYDAVVARGKVGPWKVGPTDKEPRGKTGVFKMVSPSNSVARSALLAQARKFHTRDCFKEAADCYRRALQLGYTVKTALDLADSLYSGGLGADEGIELVRRIQSENEGSFAAMLLESKLLRQTGDLASAREICAAIIRDNPRYPGAAEEMAKLSKSE